MKAFALLQHTLTTLAVFVGMMVWGVAAAPGVALMLRAWEFTQANGLPLWQTSLVLGICLFAGYFLWGLCTMGMVGVFSMLIRPRLPEARVPLKSMMTVRWGVLNASHILAKDFVVKLQPSWLVSAYFGMMGVKFGRGVQFNTVNINDAFTVSIGAETTLGGNATINGHLVEKAKDGSGLELVLAPVRIGRDVVIGTASQINPGCEIGDGAVIASRAVLPKFTKVPAGETWGGIPAKCIRRADGSRP